MEKIKSRYDISCAMHLARCWREGKMIGGEEDQVIFALLEHIEKLETQIEQQKTGDK